MNLTVINTNNNKVMMDFSMKNFAANLTGRDDNYLELSYNIRFSDAEIVTRGSKVKVVRDIWQLSGFLNNGNGFLQPFIDQNF